MSASEKQLIEDDRKLLASVRSTVAYMSDINTEITTDFYTPSAKLLAENEALRDELYLNNQIELRQLIASGYPNVAWYKFSTKKTLWPRPRIYRNPGVRHGRVSPSVRVFVYASEQGRDAACSMHDYNAGYPPCFPPTPAGMKGSDIGADQRKAFYAAQQQLHAGDGVLLTNQPDPTKNGTYRLK